MSAIRTMYERRTASGTRETAMVALEQLLDQLHRHDTTGDTMEGSGDDVETGREDAAVADRLQSLGYL